MNDYFSDDSKNLDDPRYIAKVLNGRKPRIPFRPYMEDADGNLVYERHCENECCTTRVSIAPDESEESISNKVKKLLDVRCKRRDGA